MVQGGVLRGRVPVCAQVRRLCRRENRHRAGTHTLESTHCVTGMVHGEIMVYKSYRKTAFLGDLLLYWGHHEGNEADSESPSHHKTRSRPSSALALAGRRSSMLPMRPRGLSKDDAPSALDDKPKWRP